MRGSRNIIRRFSGRNLGFHLFLGGSLFFSHMIKKVHRGASILFLWDTCPCVPARRTELEDLTTGVTGCSGESVSASLDT